jgi:tRNA dimethylallyltransferase
MMGLKPELSSELQVVVSELPEDLRAVFEALPDVPLPISDDPDAALKLHRLLAALDPTVSARWHWKDVRKVLRSLVIIKETGRKNSDIIAEQSSNSVGPRWVRLPDSHIGVNNKDVNRYRTLCYWLYAEPSVLNPRLDARVDEMVKVRGVASLEAQEVGSSTLSSKVYCARSKNSTT